MANSSYRWLFWFYPLELDGSWSDGWMPSECSNSRFFPCIEFFRNFFSPPSKSLIFIFQARIHPQWDYIRSQNGVFSTQKRQLSFSLEGISFFSKRRAWMDLNSMHSFESKGKNLLKTRRLSDRRKEWMSSWSNKVKWL